MISRFEKNIQAQPKLISELLSAPQPSWMKPPKNRRVFLVGVGTNHHAAQIAACLWNRAGIEARAVHSFDFVTLPFRLKRGDLGIFLSHRGTKSYTVRAEAMARRAGARTAVLTGAGSPWKPVPWRIETGPMEDTGAFTQSFTSTMAWLCRWAGRPALLAPFRSAEQSLRWGPTFPHVKPETDLILLGDGPREWIARETALKLQETAYLRARAFGLEEFLHGPRVSADARSLIIAFTSPREKRWDAARRYIKEIEAPWTEAATEDWLAQVLWGQRFAADACRQLDINPDLLRTDDPRYKRARELLML